MDSTGAALRRRWADLVSLGVVAVAFVLPLPGLWRAAGVPMEEGFMLVFGELVAEGGVPHVDFLHLYGPASLWVLAAAYELAGATIGVERTVGAVQIGVVVLSVWALARVRGPVVAATASLTAAVVLLPLGLVALAWVGGIAAALAGLVCLRAGDRWTLGPVVRPVPAAVADVAGGVLAAVALLYRPDLVLAVVAAVGWWLVQLTPARRVRVLAGVAVASLLWLVHLWRSGVGEAFRGMVLEPVFDLRAGRSLPVPPSWDQVDAFLQRAATLGRSEWPGVVLPQSVQIHLWFWLVPVSIAAALAGAWVLRRSQPGTPAARSLVPFALFAALLLPQALQRPDVTHLSWVSAVSFPAALVLAPELVGRWRPSWSPTRCRSTVTVVVVAVFVVVIPSFPPRGYLEAVGHTLRGSSSGFLVERDGRSFRYGSPGDAAAAQEVVDALDRRAAPGDRLIVGPASLARTVYSDAWLYSLFDELEPGTRFIEMDPGLADAPGSGLAEEVSRADWVVLSRVWKDWSEPNESVSDGDPTAQALLESSLCEVLDNGRFALYGRCDTPDDRPGA